MFGTVGALANAEMLPGANLVNFIADGDHSAHVRHALIDLEAQAGVEKRAITDLLQHGSGPVRLPTPEQTEKRALQFGAILRADPARGREELRRLFVNERVLLRPQPEGYYIAEGKLFPLALFSLRLDLETPRARDSGESSGLPALPEPEPCSSPRCAGRI